MLQWQPIVPEIPRPRKENKQVITQGDPHTLMNIQKNWFAGERDLNRTNARALPFDPGMTSGPEKES